MASLKEFRDIRLEKLNKLIELGFNPYPARANRTNEIGTVLNDFSKFEDNQETLVGRITSHREHGKLIFLDMKDFSGQIQVLAKSDDLKETDNKHNQFGFDQIGLLDLGDFVEVGGVIQKSKSGQESIVASSVRLLSKAIRPMPDSKQGFNDRDERMRRRYVDINVNPDVKERFVRRAKFWQAHRDFLNEQGFNEMNVPILEHTTGGADATPFVTHMDAIDQDFYLRISHELPLKRLVGAGYEKVYDIGARFRNENYSDEHLPEHVAMEFYWGYADWQDGKIFVKDLITYVLEKVYGTLQFEVRGMKVDLSGDWEDMDYATVIKDRFGVDVFNTNLDEIKAKLKENNVEHEDTMNLARGVDKLWKIIRKDVAGPAFLINTPTFLSPLSKANPDNPDVVERFQPIMAGSELGNGWSELNDPQEQLGRFMEQQQMRDAGDDEAQMLDIDYVEMLEYGLPPTFGYGHSERLFWTFEGVTAREGVPFPQLRAEVDSVTRSIYPDIDFEHIKNPEEQDSKD